MASSNYTTYTAIADLETDIDKNALSRGYAFKGLLKSIVRSMGGATLVDSTAISATNTELNTYTVSLDIADGSAEAVYYVVCSHAGSISKIWTVTDGVVGTADITITAAIGGTGITTGVVTIATAASAAGDIDSCVPTALNTVTAGQAVNFTVTGGGAGGTPRVHLVMEISR